MVTKKELDYVDERGNIVPYPGYEYTKEVMDKILKCYSIYTDKFKGKNYTLTLSNNEEITLEILEKNLCHLLGIDFKGIMSPYHEGFRKSILKIDDSTRLSSFDFLNIVLEKIDTILEYEEAHGGKILNYYKLGIKSDIFCKLSVVEALDFGIINFDKELFEKKSGKNFYSKSKKFLYFPSDESISPFYFLGILPEEDVKDSKYAAETLILPDNYNKFFEEQEVVIPTQILIDNGMLNKKSTSPRQKIELLKSYSSIITAFNYDNRMNISGDYLTQLYEQDKKTHSL